MNPFLAVDPRSALMIALVTGACAEAARPRADKTEGPATVPAATSSPPPARPRARTRPPPRNRRGPDPRYDHRLPRATTAVSAGATPRPSVENLSGSTEYTIARAELDTALSSMNRIAVQARIVPAFEDGKAIGFELFSVRPNSLYARVGIKNGDIIHRINGWDITSPDKALAVYSKLKTAKVFELELTRRGNPLTLTYRLVAERPAATRVADAPRSSFGVDVDTASYTLCRRRIMHHQQIQSVDVRVEEFINAFRYEYQHPPATQQNPFAVEVDGATAPFEPGLKLLRIGVQARKLAGGRREPLNLVFLVDTSGSMDATDRLPLAQASLEIALSRLAPTDRIAIIAYASSVVRILPPTFAANRKAIRAAIADLEAGGITAMGDGLAVAYRRAREMLEPGYLTRVMVLSDGGANVGATTADEMLGRVRQAIAAGVTVSTIGFGADGVRDPLMERLADAGNGNYHFIDSIEQAARVFGRGFDAMVQEVAKDVKIQVDFAPGAVEAYELVGYDNRSFDPDDFADDRRDAGEIGADDQVTAFYRLRLAERPTGILGTVRLRAKRPRGDRSIESSFVVPLAVVQPAFREASSDFRFAAAVMSGAELLRYGRGVCDWTFEDVVAVAEGANPDRSADRLELIALLRRAASFR